MLTRVLKSSAYPAHEEFRYDSSGNMVWRTGHAFVVAIARNRLLQDIDSTTGTAYPFYFAYDSNGNRNIEYSGQSIFDDHTTYYDALSRMSGNKRYVPGQIGFDTLDVPNACYYDPDGQFALNCVNGVWHTFDGANVVRAGDYWTVGQGPGLDDPLVALNRAPQPSQRMEAFFITDGTGRQYAVGDSAGLLTPALQSSQAAGLDALGGTTNASSFSASRMRPGSSGRQAPGCGSPAWWVSSVSVVCASRLPAHRTRDTIRRAVSPR